MTLRDLTDEQLEDMIREAFRGEPKAKETAMEDRLVELQEVRDDLETFGQDDEEYTLYAWAVSEIERLRAERDRLEKVVAMLSRGERILWAAMEGIFYDATTLEDAKRRSQAGMTNSLPELTPKEKAAVDSLGDDFVQRILKEAGNGNG